MGTRTGRAAARSLVVCAGVCAIVSGCAVGTDTEKMLEATARAERRIGVSGAQALSSIAAVATSAGTALDSVGALVSDSRAGLASVTLEAAGTLGEARHALGEVAAIVSDARPAAREAAGLIGELRGIAASARVDLDGGGVSRRLLIGLIVLVAAVLVHGVIAHIRLHRRVGKLHEHVRSKLP